jgi:putative colanic acid biosynthesis UDP-glucose lipid carrier transferase
VFSQIVVWFFSASFLRYYDDFRLSNFSIELVTIIKIVSIQALNLTIALFTLNYDNSRDFILYYVGMILILSIADRFFIRSIFIRLRLEGRNLRSLLIIGAGEVGKKFYDTIKKNPQFGYNVIGFLDDNLKTDIDDKYIGPLSELENILNKVQIDHIVITLPNYAHAKVDEIVRICQDFTTYINIIPDYFRFSSSKYNVSMFGPFPIFSVREDSINEFQWRLLKRAFDVIFSFSVIILLISWLYPLIGLLIKISSPGPILYRQERWGRNNRKFVAYKFRSMVYNHKDIDEQVNFQQATKNDARITKFGKFIRETNIDEFPQFINVFLGQMSVVGPRPHPTPLNIKYKNDINQYMVRHFVKSGITGWAQVNGFRGETIDSTLMEKRVKYDIWYIEHWSIWLDLKIVILTILQMLTGDPNAY